MAETTAIDELTGLPTTVLEARYRAALQRYEGTRLLELFQGLGGTDLTGKAGRLPELISERLQDVKQAERLASRLSNPARLFVTIATLTDRTEWPLIAAQEAMRLLGVAGHDEAIAELLALGLAAIQSVDEGVIVTAYEVILRRDPATLRLLIHPSTLKSSRTALPTGAELATTQTVRQVRETDGLEPILRLAAVWQRIEESPLRETQQKTFYKRDRERLEDDPVLSGPITDAIEPLPDMAMLWIALSRGLGLLIDEDGTDRLVAADAEYWSENAIHLPQMIANRWLGLARWHDQQGIQAEPNLPTLLIPYLRTALLLWLATCEESAWVPIEELAAFLDERSPTWTRSTLDPRGPLLRNSPEGTVGLVRAVLLGSAYQFGLVRYAEEDPSGRGVLQLSPLGRYTLAIGSPPEPRPYFPQFLFVQPNFEIIAYRQGLTPSHIGQLSRFTRWTKVGGALELKLTAESVYRGLEGGMTTDAMLDRLGRHSSRALPNSVADSLRTWAGRRERITYYASATLIEFATTAELEAALASWPSGSAAPVRVSDRLLLVEDESAIPFHRFRMVGARDYRRPAEACVDVEDDGVTLALDLGRSDLLVDAELARFADEAEIETDPRGEPTPQRKFLVTRESLERGLDRGLTPQQLDRWFQQRAGQSLPASVKLLLHAAGPTPEPLKEKKLVVIQVPSSDLLDGLYQHPRTREYLSERLGPTAAVVAEPLIPSLRRALEDLGLQWISE